MEDGFERAARRELDGPMAAWRIHLAVYVAIQVMLVVTWWLTSQGDGDVMPWFLFPLLGWGAGLAAHYMAARNYSRNSSRRARGRI